MVVTGSGSYLCSDKAKVNDAEILIDVLSLTCVTPCLTSESLASRQRLDNGVFLTFISHDEKHKTFKHKKVKFRFYTQVLVDDDESS